LALLSKSSVVVLPLILVLLAWWRHGAISRPTLVRLAPFFLASLAFGLMTIWIHYVRNLAAGHTDSLLVRLLGGSWSVWFYLGKALLPINLTMHYPRWNIQPAAALSWLPGLLILALSLIFWRARRGWGRPYLLGLGYFLLALSPVLGFLKMASIKYFQVADHFQYLALPGIVALAAGRWCCLALPADLPASPAAQRRKLLLSRAVPVFVVGLLAALSWQYQTVVTTRETLWRDNIAKNPHSALAHNDLGVVLLSQDKMDEAITHFQTALSIDPTDWITWYNLGTLRGKQDQPGLAELYFARALQLDPTAVSAHINRAVALEKLDRLDDAAAEYRLALRLNPDRPDAHNSLAVILLFQGQAQEALAHGLQALRLRPGWATAHYQVANALFLLGRTGEALDHYAAVLRLEPGHYEAHNNFGKALANLGRLDEAVPHFEQAIRLKPDFAEAHTNLAAVLNQRGPTSPR